MIYKNNFMYYILKIATSYIKNDIEEIFASLDGEKAHSDGTGYLFPRHIEDFKEVKEINDIHGWIGTKPFDFFGYPISDRFKFILEKYNLYNMNFIPVKVLYENEYYNYFGWDLDSTGLDALVDFNHSTFCEWKKMEKYGNEVIQVENIDELIDYELEKEWWGWGFEKAVMKPEFKSVDCIAMPYPYGTLISERLKNGLEKANLTGFEITPFPVEFEYL